MTTLTPEQQQNLAQRFQGLATQWNAATRYRSNTHALRHHPVYQELVALGGTRGSAKNGRGLTKNWALSYPSLPPRHTWNRTVDPPGT